MNIPGETLSAFVLDDELLAVRRLSRMIASRIDIQIIGSSTSPEKALELLNATPVDLLFLDIMMPGMTGFELLERLTRQPIVVFTTAYDKHALKAFEVNSIDYLLKPIAPEHLDRAIKKVTAIRNAGLRTEFEKQLSSLTEQIKNISVNDYADRIASRIGDRTVLIELAHITHFVSEDKMTFALTEEKRYIVDNTLTDLERRLTSRGFQRIHRATLINLTFVDELHRWFGGRLLLRLKDKKQTELTVSRDMTHALKARLGLS